MAYTQIDRARIRLGQAFNLANERMLSKKEDIGTPEQEEKFKALTRKYYYLMKNLEVEMGLFNP